jgi:ribosome-binding factor A
MKSATKPGRGLRIADQIQRDVAEMIQREVSVERAGLVTLTGVEVSADYAHAKVYFTALTGREHADAAAAALARTAGFLRSQLSQRLKVFTVPQLHFIYDDSIETGMRVSQLIDEAIADDRKHPQD